MNHNNQTIYNINQAPQRLASAVYRISALPSAPTFDWPTTAADALSQLAPSAAFAVIIANINPATSKIHTEASGVNANTNHPATANPYESRSTLDRLGAISQRHAPNLSTNALITDASTLLPHWHASEPSTPWRSTLPQRTLIGCASLTKHTNSELPAASQLITLICIAAPSPTTADQIDTDMFASAVSTLAHKATTINNAQPNSSINWLTQREQTILNQLILGCSVREIAEHINRSPHTVHDHVKNLHKKLNASSRGELIAKSLGYQDQPIDSQLPQPLIDTELTTTAAELIEHKQLNPATQEPRPLAQPLNRSSAAL